MEFNKKLQELRRQKGLTQEQLAEALFVSRTAVSKWESGRGYPSIDSLKKISEILGVTVDELLSTDELVSLAEEEGTQKRHLIDLLFGLFDISAAFLLFLPFFAQKSDSIINEVSLLSLSLNSVFLTAVYFVFVAITVVFGVLTLAMQNCKNVFWNQIKSPFSVTLSLLGTLLFIISLQPYAAVFLFLFLIIKVLVIIKR